MMCFIVSKYIYIYIYIYIIYILFFQRSDKNNANTLSIIWEFENRIVGRNFSIIYKSLLLS